MNGVAVLRENIQWGYQVVEMVMADVTDEQARWVPPGEAHPIGALYAHSLLAADGVLNALLKGGAPRFATEWAGQLGDAPPQMHNAIAWGRAVRPDLPAVRAYGQTIMADVEAYLNTLSDADLDRMVDIPEEGMGQRSVSFVINALIAGHLHNIAGEISALKGTLGLKGYPF